MVAIPRTDPSDRIYLVGGVAGPESLRPHSETATEIRVIVASPVHLVREGLAAILRDCHGVVLAHTVDLEPTRMAEIARAQPDVVLVDLGRTDPITAARLIMAASPGAKLVGFGVDETDDHVIACAAAGFCGYVTRESGARELHRAVADAMEGRMHCTPHIAAAIFARLADLLREPVPKMALPSLSSRESEILALVEQGRSNKEIARQLVISSATVKNHIHNLLQKLQVTRRGQAAARLRAHHG